MASQTSQAERHARLRDAETKAGNLFAEAERRNLIRSGITEKTLNKELYKLAFEMCGIEKYWHKRIVRAGPNTVHPYREKKNNNFLTIAVLFYSL